MRGGECLPDKKRQWESSDLVDVNIEVIEARAAREPMSIHLVFFSMILVYKLLKLDQTAPIIRSIQAPNMLPWQVQVFRWYT